LAYQRSAWQYVMDNTGQYNYPQGELIIFARAPVPGQVKSRLAAGIGKQAAAECYRVLLVNTVELAASSDIVPHRLEVDADTGHQVFRSLTVQFNISVTQQCDGDLGRKMAHSLGKALEYSEFALIIGSDCPAITADYIQAACLAMYDGHDVVIGPAEDGGYVLIGSRVNQPAMFANIPWGSGQVLARTRERLHALGLSCKELDMLWDIDRPGDYERWQNVTACESYLI